MLRGIYALTDSALLPSDFLLLGKVESALRAGVCVIQYRDKSNDATKRQRQSAALLDLCKQFNVPLIINDDVNLAKKINADGVHLGQQDISLIEARNILGNSKIIGVTCHDSLMLAQHAETQGAHYVAFGSCFSSPTKPQAKLLDLNMLQQARQTLHIPIVAIGGINSENARSVIETGIDMIAVVSAIFAHDDVFKHTQQLTHLFI